MQPWVAVNWALFKMETKKTTFHNHMNDNDVPCVEEKNTLRQGNFPAVEIKSTVVLCLYDCHGYRKILRSRAILHAQLHMLYRHPASRCNVTNATKTYAFRDVNAEACVVDKELFDGKEHQEDSPEEYYKEKEFSTLGDKLDDFE